MLFLVFGSSAAGKTAAVNVLRHHVRDLAIHEFDEIGVPPGADTAWRHRANEEWVRRALAYERDATDLVLAGQTPFGELLATPSAPDLEAISACLIDCDDATRVARLRERGADWFRETGSDPDDYLAWAEWMRHHARDPRWRPEAIRHEATEREMEWTRWSGWITGDPRWRVRVIDTTALSVDQVAARLAGWIAEERGSLRARVTPLAKQVAAS